MRKEHTIRTATFNPKVCTYWLLSGAVALAVTCVGIPLLLLWFPLGLLITKRYLDAMECTLTDKALKIGKGLFVRVEKTVPLDKITDIGMVQGPIMRAFDLHTLTFETAGQSSEGALVSLTGIEDAKGFREEVLRQRDVMASQEKPPAVEQAEQSSPTTQLALLTEIRDTLLRMEANQDANKD